MTAMVHVEHSTRDTTPGGEPRGVAVAGDAAPLCHRATGEDAP